MIPKIIHQTAPVDKADWHPIWFRCQESWKKHYNDFEYILWNDSDIHSLIEKYYPEYFDLYCSFPIHILKIDFSRFCILDHMGGIYADMDMFCFTNFYNELTKKAHIIQAHVTDCELVENSLMAGVSNNSFFQRCMKTSMERFYHAKTNDYLFNGMIGIHNDYQVMSNGKSFLIFYITGSNLVSNVFRKFDKNYVDSLSAWRYNNYEYSYDKEFRTKHMHSISWGNEDRMKARFLAAENNITIDDHIKAEYKRLRLIDLDNFDFYTDYTNGSYVKQDFPDKLLNDLSEENFTFQTTYI